MSVEAREGMFPEPVGLPSPEEMDRLCDDLTVKDSPSRTSVRFSNAALMEIAADWLATRGLKPCDEPWWMARIRPDEYDSVTDVEMVVFVEPLSP